MKHAVLILTLVGMLVALTLDYGKTRSNSRLAVEQAQEIQQLRASVAACENLNSVQGDWIRALVQDAMER